MSNVGKYSLIALVFIIIAGGGVSLLSQKPIEQGEAGQIISERTGPGEISNLLTNLERETRISFSEVNPDEFNWLIAGEGVSTSQIHVLGEGFTAREISDGQQRAIDDFFESRGFEIDLYNIFSGTMSGAAGYSSGSTVCLVSGGIEDEGRQWVEVKCGKL